MDMTNADRNVANPLTTAEVPAAPLHVIHAMTTTLMTTVTMIDGMSGSAICATGLVKEILTNAKPIGVKRIVATISRWRLAKNGIDEVDLRTIVIPVPMVHADRETGEIEGLQYEMNR